MKGPSRLANCLISLTTCCLQKHMANICSDKKSMGCQNGDKLVNKSCNLIT